MNKLILITGMHRSGTSLVSSIINHAGIPMGKLLPANQDNPHGYYENSYLMHQNDYLLRHLNLSWDSLSPLPSNWLSNTEPYKTNIKNYLIKHPTFGMKDPRLCRLLPMWLEIIQDLSLDYRIVYVVRNPMAVVRSLVKRQKPNCTEDTALKLWELYNKEFKANNVEHITVDYDLLTRQPEKYIKLICEWIGQPYDSNLSKLIKAKGG